MQMCKMTLKQHGLRDGVLCISSLRPLKNLIYHLMIQLFDSGNDTEEIKASFTADTSSLGQRLYYIVS